MEELRPRDRFKRLVRSGKARRNYVVWGIWAVTIAMVLQFFVPLALNSIEARVKPNQLCPVCINPSALRWCPIDPTNRTCPECGREWNAPYHEILSMPWIIVAVQYRFGWR